MGKGVPSWKPFLPFQGLCCPLLCGVCARGQLKVVTSGEAFFPCGISLVELGGITLSPYCWPWSLRLPPALP